MGKTVRINCDNLFSDLLYRPFLCAHTPIDLYTSSIPARNKIPHLSDLSEHEFESNWTDHPFILTKPVTEWHAYHHWSMDRLLEEYGDVQFRAEAVDWPLRTYLDYMNNTSDESPLYLFDRSFVEKMKITSDYRRGAYWTPSCFGKDLFGVLGDQRPDHRWLIIGPQRSGSTFHKDPNATR